MNLENVLLRGTRAAQPAANLVAEGALYYVIDENKTEQSRSSTWVTYTDGGAAAITQLTGDVTAGPGSGSQAATIANNAVTTAKINNDAVTYAKIQNITTARLLGRATAGSGDAEEITLGTGLALAGTTLNASGGGGLVLLSTLTASSSASLDLTSLITSTYDVYLLQLLGIKPSTSATLRMRVSSDNGSSWISSANYDYNQRYANFVATNGIQQQNAKTEIEIAGVLDSGSAGADGEIRIFNPLAAIPTHIRIDVIGKMNDAQTYDLVGSARYTQNTAINAVQFFMNTGNIASGVIRVYGHAKT